MASITVNLKVTPQELRIIEDALRMYGYAWRHSGRDFFKHPLEGFQFHGFLNNDLKHSQIAEKIRRDIELR